MRAGPPEATTADPGADPAAMETRLLAACAAGDPSAARALAQRLGPRLVATATRLLGDGAEAEDVAQEALLRLWRIAPDWRSGEARPATWAHRVAVNLCLDRLRRRAALPIEAADRIADPAPLPLAVLEARDRAQALTAALAALPDRQRVAVALRHFEERSNPEIAAAMGASVEAVESLLARGHRTLAAALAAHDDRRHSR